MHDLRWIRDNPTEFDRGLTRRGLPPCAGEILAPDRSWRAAETRAQEAQSRRNRVAREVGAAEKRGEAIAPLLRQTGEDRGGDATTAPRAGHRRAPIRAR